MSRRRSSERDGRGHSQRQLRVGEEIRHLLADLLERGNMRDPELRGTSITVTPSLDTQQAIVRVNAASGHITATSGAVSVNFSVN